MESTGEAQPESMLAQKVASSGPAEVEVRLGPAAGALARSFAEGGHNGALAQILADVFPFATTIRLGVKTNGGVLLLSSCLLAEGGSPAIFFAVPNCPSALQECLDSGLCGFYLRSDAHKPDLHLLWRGAPHTMAALCGAVPSLGHLPGAHGCAAALLVGIRRGDNSLVSAELTCLARAFAQHLPEVLAHVSKGEDAYAPIPDPGSALHGLQPPSTSSRTPTSSSCHSSDNTCSAGQAGKAQASPQSGSTQSTVRSSSGISSGSLSCQLPVCPEGVSVQEDLAWWEPAWDASEHASEETWLTVLGHVSSRDVSASSGAGSGSTLGSDDLHRGDRVVLDVSSLVDSREQLPETDTEGSMPVAMIHSNPSTGQRSPAWDDDLQSGSRHTSPSTAQPESMAPAGFALFDSASSDPGTNNGPASKGGALKAEQTPVETVISTDSLQELSHSIDTTGMHSSIDGDLGVPPTILEDDQSIWHQPARLGCEYDTAEESDASSDAPGAMPARSGARGRRARASRARARARGQRAQARQVQQQPESSSTSSYWQGALAVRRRGGNSSDSDTAVGRGSTPYRRRSPQHPFWLSFLDPVLEAAFVAWQAQQQFKGDVLSAVLTIFVLLTELAHPSLEGPAFKLQACTSTIAAGALFMIVLQRERWQRSRELLTSCLHCVISGAILLFVFPAWARSLRGPKLRSLMWLFRFSGSEGSCAVPFIFMLRFRRALWNQALLLLASAAVSLPAVCVLPDAVKPPRRCFGLGLAMEAAAFVLPLAAVHLLERRARSSFLQSPAALLPHAD